MVKGPWQDALLLARRRHGEQADVKSCGAVVAAHGAGRDWQKALLHFWHASRYGPETNLLLVNAALNALSKSCKSGAQRPSWPLATALLQQMQQALLQWNQVSIGAASGATPKWFMSLAWLSWWANEQIVGQTADAMAKAAMWQQTLNLHQWQDAEGCRNVVLCSCTAEACRISGHWAMAMQVLLPIFNHGCLQPDTVCCGTALAAYATGAAWLEAQLLLRRSGAWRLRHDAAAYGAVAQAIAADGRGEAAAKVLEELLQRHLQPTLTLQNIVASAIAWEKALNLVATFAAGRCGMRGDAVTINVLVKVCAQEQQWQRAANDVYVMMQKGLSPDLVSHVVTMAAFGYGKRWEMVLLQLSEDWKSNDISSGAAIAACANADSWNTALWLLQASSPNDLTLRTTSAAAAKGSAAGSAAWRPVVVMLATFKTNGLQATPGTMEAVSSLLARGNLWQVALQQEEVEFGALPPSPQSADLAAQQAMHKLKQGWTGG